MKKKLILIIVSVCVALGAIVGTVLIIANKNNEDVSSPPIEFAQSQIEMLVGENKQLTINNLEKKETLTFTTNDEKVVVVNENGEIQAKGVGSAVVKVVSSKGRSGLVYVIVYDPENYPVPFVSIKHGDINLFVGDEFPIEYTHTYLGKTIEGTVTITSGNESIATVSNQTVRAVGKGETTVLISVSSSYGIASKSIKVVVKEKEMEFYPSFLGKDIYVGNPIDLALFVNEDGTVKTVDGAEFSVSDTEIATVESGKLVPKNGGDTEIAVSFEYGGKNYQKELPIHVYGPHTCKFTYIDGSVDYSIEATYGDLVYLELENPIGNPENNKPIKVWYVDGEKVTDEYFIMPDKDVEVSVRFIGETEDNFESSFKGGFLLNNLSASIKYINEPFEDGKGNVSDMDGYVRFFTESYGSSIFTFDEPVTVNDYAYVSIRLYATDDSPLLYFGTPSELKWPENQTSAEYVIKKAEKKYEASPCGSNSGDVPCLQFASGEWVVLELPLNAFANVGEVLSGISICSASIAKEGKYEKGGEVLIDYISVNYGLRGSDIGYLDRAQLSQVLSKENGSREQADAIGEYHRFSLGLTEEQRNSQEHIQNVNIIRNLIANSFTKTTSYANDPTVTGSGVHDAGNNKNGATGYHTNYKTTYDTFHVVQFNANTFDGKITLGKFNFSACEEAYFGLYANSTGNGSINILGQVFNFDNSKEHFFKVLIKNGTLTVTDDSKDDKDGGVAVITVNLSSDVLNGLENLSIDFAFDAWSQAEITEMRVTQSSVVAMMKHEPTVSGATYKGSQAIVGMGNVHPNYNTEYQNYYMTQFASGSFDGTFTLSNINFNSATEVSFGLFMITSTNGELSIFGQKFTFDNSKEHYFKVVIKNGVLTVTDDSKNNSNGGATVITVALSSEILSGETALSIDFNFTAWSQVEMTDVYYTLTQSDII